MKKGLLLSVIASTMIFAGGEITPVDVPAPAADCSDFSGHVGLYFNTIDNDLDVDVTDGDLFGKNTSTLDAAASIHVEKEIAYGIGFGATAGGIAQLYNDNLIATDAYDGNNTTGGLAEIYLTASFGNTAAKIGRFALPGSLSPLASSDDTDGVYTDTFQGVLLANTDFADTTIYGAALTATVRNGIDTEIKTMKDGNNNAIFTLGVQNTSIAGTKITAVGYYQSSWAWDGTNEADALAGVLTVNTKIDNYGVDAQVAYIDGGFDNTDATIAAALKVSGKYDMFGVWAQVEYINDGGYGIGDLFGHESLMADADSKAKADVTAFKAGVNNIALGFGKAYVSAEYRTWGDNSTTHGSDDTKTIVDIGYDFKYVGVNFNAEYEYTSTDTGAENTTDTSELSLSAVYKF